MKNSNRPAGPGQPTHLQRAQADEREEIDEALNPQAERDPREGHQPTRNQPSPQPRNESVRKPGGRQGRG
ncbi:MAG: hypothetical protein AB1430_07430 [Pseudomonadota bacterium]